MSLSILKGLAVGPGFESTHLEKGLKMRHFPAIFIHYEMFFWTLGELGITKKRGSNPPYAGKEWSNNSYKADALIVGQSSP